MSSQLLTLIVDDNPQDRLLVIRELKRQLPESRVSEVADLEDLTRALLAEEPGLVITDYQLRWSDGLDVLREVKARYPESPVIMFTASGNEEIAVEAMKAGLDDYIIKSPRHLVRLGASIRTALERAEARRKAAHLELRLQSLLNRLNVAVFRCTPAHSLLECNPAFLRLLGVGTLQEAQERGLHELFATGPEIAAGEHAPWEIRLNRTGAEPLWVSVSVSVTTDVSGQLVVEGLVEDIDRRKAMEEDLQRQAQQLAEAGRRKDEFLAVLAHELRNPLAPLRNALHILQQTGVPADVSASARAMMDRQLRNLTRLIDDLLDVSRIARGKVELRREWVDVAQSVSRTVEAVRGAITGPHPDITVHVPREPVLVDADPVRLEQVVGNLLDNALKYTKPEGKITVQVEQGGTEIVIRVRDTGAGIPPDMLERIFEPFTQVERSRASASQWGLGIGLTLVRSLVSLHGGRVQAHSAGPDLGSDLVVHLPAAAPALSQTPLPSEQAPRSAGPLRVLAVDDSHDSADSLAAMLRLYGHDVDVAYGGQEALDLARTFRPQVVLLDIGMPGMDGYEVADRLRKLPDLPGLVLVALTGWGQEEARRRSQEAGFDHHLIKPVEPATLQRLLAEQKVR